MSNKPTTAELIKGLRGGFVSSAFGGLMSEAADRLEAAEIRIADRLLTAVLWVFWSGAMLLTGFLYAMSIV